MPIPLYSRQCLQSKEHLAKVTTYWQSLVVTFVLREIRFLGKRRNSEASIFKDQTSERLGQYEQPKKKTCQSFRLS